MVMKELKRSISLRGNCEMFLINKTKIYLPDFLVQISDLFSYLELTILNMWTLGFVLCDAECLNFFEPFSEGTL